MVAEELRRQPRIAQLLLHDRPRGMPEPVGMQLRHAVRDTQPRADILGTTHGEPLPPPGREAAAR